MTDHRPVIYWFRQDLRVADNPALRAAIATGRPVIPLFTLDERASGVWCPGGASRWWLHHSLQTLDESLNSLGMHFILRRGSAEETLMSLVSETNASAVFWNRCYDPFSIARDTDIKRRLTEAGVTAKSFNGSLLYEPWEIETKAGGFYKVYTRYWHACREKGDPSRPAAIPDRVDLSGPEVRSDDLDDWGLLPTKPDWAAGMRARWRPGEAGAMARLDSFLDQAATSYRDQRNNPAVLGTSNLSPFLHIGDISPRQVWHRTVDRLGWTADTEAFLKELVWREFAHHLFYYMPSLPEEPMNAKFAAFPWVEDERALTAWERGQTGYPMVDAGMRELWQTGFMHNRVRMIVGSFLVKHLLLPWQAGEAWFWDTLVDADLAVNSFSWQWIAGCGADAAPYFRIFNPITQGEKFDPKGDYVRTYVPEIARLPDKFLFKPWEAPMDVLAEAGVALGKTYPYPIVDHKAARERALSAFKSLPKAE